jgi:sugar phosphate isomerase/epimerase
MNLAAMLTSLPLGFPAAVRQALELGFHYVDIVALAERPVQDLSALADAGMIVSCAAAGRDLPVGATLDAEALELRRGAVEMLQRHVTDAAQLGATHAYIVPGLDTSAASLRRFADSCTRLADFAGQRHLRLCVEAVPGRALPTGAATLDWVSQIGHPNLFLLLDVGHCLISREEPAAIIEQAGPRLGYLHLDDNDGANDVHWPLLTGKMTRTKLQSALQALVAVGYGGNLAFELNPKNANPFEALRQGKALVEDLMNTPAGI